MLHELSVHSYEGIKLKVKPVGISAKWNSRNFPQLKMQPSICQKEICKWFPLIVRQCIPSTKHGSSIMKQMVHFGKNDERGVRVGFFHFSRKDSNGRNCSICCPTGRNGFPFKRKALKVFASQALTPTQL